MQADPLLLIKTQNEQHPTNQADLVGKRMVITIEVEEGKSLAEVTVKVLTGQDPIKARRMREDFWEFFPTHKLFLAANHRPVITGRDPAIWRRIRLVPWDVTIPEGERDKGLQQKLMAEASGILAWAVRGCLDWQVNGMQVPAAVRAATKKYEDEQDILRDFFEDCCDLGDDYWERLDALVDGINQWFSSMRSTEVWSSKRMSVELENRGFRREKPTKGEHRLKVIFHGLHLKTTGRDGGDEFQQKTENIRNSKSPGQSDVLDVPRKTHDQDISRARAWRVNRITKNIENNGLPAGPLVDLDEGVDGLIAGLDALGADDVVAIDTETQGLDIWNDDRLLGLCVGWGGRGWYVPVGHDDGNVSAEACARLVEALNRCTAVPIFFNAQFEWAVLEPHGYRPPFDRFVDTQILCWLIDEERMSDDDTKRQKDGGLKELCRDWCGVADAEEARDGLKCSPGGVKWRKLTPEAMAPYGAGDAVLTQTLFTWLQERLEDVAPAIGREHALQGVLYRMSRHGVHVDVDRVAEAKTAAENRRAELLGELGLETPRKGVIPLLYGDRPAGWALPVLEFTGKKGDPSTAGPVLEQLIALGHTEVEKLREARKLDTALSRYFKGFTKYGGTGVIHAQFASTRQVTGRLSCTNPPLMQIPRDDEGSVLRPVRQCLVAAPGRVLWSADLSQAELRASAAVSGDPAMCAAILDGRDLHDEAAEMFYGEVNKASRRAAKVVSLGVQYGMGVERLAQQLYKRSRVNDEEMEEAARLRTQYRKKYRGLADAIDAFAEMARENGGVLPAHANYPGRFRHFTGYSGEPRWYTAFNFLCQGGIAEIVKSMMLEIDRQIEPYGAMVLQLHDELIFELQPGSEETVLALLREITDKVNHFSLPLVWEAK